MVDVTKPDAPAAPPAPGTPEHDAKMVALATERMGLEEPKPVDKPQKPAGVPDKFWDAEKGAVRVDDLAKSYTELEKQRGQQPAVVKPVDTPAKEATVDEQKAFLTSKGVTAEDLAKLDEAGVKAKYAELNKPAVAAAKPEEIDLKDVNAEYAEKGELSAETRAKLDAKYGKEVVDSYLAGQQALADKYNQAAFTAAGDEATFKAMNEWASANFTAADAKVYNEAVTSGDVAKMSLAVQGLKARYEKAEGKAPTLIQGENLAAGQEGYKTRDEMVKAMRDPRYKKDAAYRATVEAKVGRATF